MRAPFFSSCAGFACLCPAGLSALETLEFPGHARAFTGASMSTLAVSLPVLSHLVISSNKPGAVDYTLALPALAGLRALTRRCAGWAHVFDEGTVYHFGACWYSRQLCKSSTGNCSCAHAMLCVAVDCRAFVVCAGAGDTSVLVVICSVQQLW
jgi:hypothetical protein